MIARLLGRRPAEVKAPLIEPGVCAHCRSDARGALMARVVGGVGLRLLCVRCEVKLRALGLDIHDERRAVPR